jgi:GTPase SAR1 family protein
MCAQSGNSDAATNMLDINIAVLGARGAGKSSFIRRALDQPNTASPAVTARKMNIDGSVYVVRFLEMSFAEVSIGDRNTINWPEKVGTFAKPRIDGAITIYDVTSQSSLANVPEMLGNDLDSTAIKHSSVSPRLTLFWLGVISRAPLPFVLVACKCDAHNAIIQADMVEQKARNFLGELTAFQTTETSTDTYRSCVSIITRNIITARRREYNLRELNYVSAPDFPMSRSFSPPVTNT